MSRTMKEEPLFIGVPSVAIRKLFLCLSTPARRLMFLIKTGTARKFVRYCCNIFLILHSADGLRFIVLPLGGMLPVSRTCSKRMHPLMCRIMKESRHSIGHVQLDIRLWWRYVFRLISPDRAQLNDLSDFDRSECKFESNRDGW